MYSALDDIKKLCPEDTLIQLTDDDDVGVVSQTRVDEAIASADAVIDSYCGRKYSVPFAVVPDIVKAISIDITIYNLYSRRMEEIPATRTDRYKNAMAQLRDIAAGKVSIGEDPEPSASSQSAHETEMSSEDRSFTRTKMEDF
ncbi:MAG: DUF1320 domain-containing protein [Deltaproteobacteria bacterium]|nr:DUF1320 domain-containing protein [Deltaproteobacteria bacterium]